MGSTDVPETGSRRRPLAAVAGMIHVAAKKRTIATVTMREGSVDRFWVRGKAMGWVRYASIVAPTPSSTRALGRTKYHTSTERWKKTCMPRKKVGDARPRTA